MQKPSTTNWIIPERHDLLMVLDAKVIENADGTVSPTAHSGDPIEDFTQTRSAFLVQSAIDRVRAAIRNHASPGYRHDTLGFRLARDSL